MTTDSTTAFEACFAGIDFVVDEDLTKDNLKKHELKDGGSLRIVPLLAATRAGNSRQIVVGSISIVSRSGRVRLWVRTAEVVTVGQAGDHTSLSETPGSACSRESRDKLSAHLKLLLAESLPGNSSAPYSDEELVVFVAKNFAERSADALEGLRAMRYDLERQLIKRDNVRAHSQLSASSIISSLTLMGIIVGRAADHCRQILREGLWLHATNSAAYHAYRRHRDPSLLKAGELLDVRAIAWMPKHDAATRHCQSMENQLREESRSLRAILSAASTISGANEADSQRRLNYIVASASIALGLPALIFSLYGANILEDLKDFSQSEWIMIVLVGLGSCFLALILAWVKKARKLIGSWWMFALALGLVVLALQGAISLVPKSSDDSAAPESGIQVTDTAQPRQ